jgi:hypothetical protein
MVASVESDFSSKVYLLLSVNWIAHARIGERLTSVLCIPVYAC